jgi:hypothetical protein
MIYLPEKREAQMPLPVLLMQGRGEGGRDLECDKGTWIILHINDGRWMRRKGDGGRLVVVVEEEEKGGAGLQVTTLRRRSFHLARNIS